MEKGKIELIRLPLFLIGDYIEFGHILGEKFFKIPRK